MPDRRYTDDEVRRILALATEAEAALATPAERAWSLRDVEQIGAEAGIAPAAVTAAQPPPSLPPKSCRKRRSSTTSTRGAY